MKDITDINDVKKLVDDFYDSIRQDELLGDIFNRIILENWDNHLQKMYRFWQTILLEEHTYFGSPFAPHASMSLKKNHFDRWIHLFTATIHKNFSGPQADKALNQALRMAEIFQIKINHLDSINHDNS